MKPTIICLNFDPPEDLFLFMKESFGDILRISPYESHVEATIEKGITDYVMTISINYSEGQFKTMVKDLELKSVITQSMADIFTQVRGWWKSRFGSPSLEKTDWAGDFSKRAPKTEEILIENGKKSLTVLIVDDDVESVTPLELCLERLGCTTFIVNNGFEAIHEILSDDRIYDLVVLDWSMPEMTGGQALLNAQKVISQAPRSNSHWKNGKLPVITFSSRSRSEIDLPECEDFNHLDHWEKPSSYLHLLNQASETLSKLKEEKVA